VEGGSLPGPKPKLFNSLKYLANIQIRPCPFAPRPHLLSFRGAFHPRISARQRIVFVNFRRFFRPLQVLAAAFALVSSTASISAQPDEPILDPNRTPFPRSSLHDFSELLQAPAGTRGFLQRKGEHFYWADGTRARFWGINIANTTLNESDAQIDKIVRNFAAAGFNLLRLHHFDERGGIIDLNRRDSRHFDPEAVRKLDYWIFKAKQAGIHVYLDLLDYRHFKSGDGVPSPEGIGRGARPYSVFDPHLIELQKEYAKKLLRDHVNPYTKLAYADDPAVVMLELYDESGLFMRRDVWRSMPQPYARNFQALWNAWLKAKYKTTEALAASWSDPKGALPPLQSGENLEKNTVQVPAMTWYVNQLPEAQKPFAGQSRLNDGALFANDVHIKYFRDMKKFLRGIGVKVPISATGRFDDIADLRGLSREMDYIGANFYYDHPFWGVGKASWTPPSFYHNTNPVSDIDDRSMAATISLARVHGVPLVVREWNYCWPNRSRSTGMIEAATYAALHDVDAMILFAYETKPTARVSYFNVRSDPSRWGLAGICAQIFLKGLIQPSTHRIVVPYNTVDAYTYTRYYHPLYALGWVSRVENDFYDGPTYKVADGRNVLIVPPGRSGLGTFEGAPAVLHTSSLARDLSGRQLSTPKYLEEYGLVPQPVGNVALTYDGLLFDAGAQQTRDLELGLPLAPLSARGLKLLGHNGERGVAAGFVDEAKQRFVCGNLEPMDVLRASLDAMQTFYGVPNAHNASEQNVLGADNGQMWRDAASGRLVVSAPQVQALCGNMVGVGRVLAPGLRVRNFKSGTLVAVALDGQPLVSSKRFVIKMVSDTRNVDEKSGRDPRFLNQREGLWKLDELGEGPVRTGGQPSNVPLSVAIESRQLCEVFLQSGGGFELFVDGDKSYFYCDTPGTRYRIYRQKPGAPVASGVWAKNVNMVHATG